MFIFEIEKQNKNNFKILSTKNMFGLNIGIINDYSYLRQQHFHRGLHLQADASCSLLGLIKETNCTPLFLLHSTPRLAVALKYVSKCGHRSKIYDRV